MESIQINKSVPIIGIVSPCYNEEAVLPESGKQFNDLIERLVNKGLISEKSFIAFVDDGSRDKTWDIIQELNNQYKYVKGLKMAGNVGHQKALLGGLLSFKNDADALVSIDCDLQDDLNVIEAMIIDFTNGSDVVYGVRKQRTTDTWFKRRTALAFYSIMLSMKVKVVYNHADFRLSSKRVLEGLEMFEESNLFLRGIFPAIGYKSSNVYYDRLERFAGESKYPIKKMISFAWDGITSFSSRPLRVISSLGFLIFFGCLLMIFYALISFLLGKSLQGWFSTVLPMYFLGGIQLLCLGVIGEYIGKIYNEVKRRPRFIVDQRLD